jgi:hypothetical protein
MLKFRLCISEWTDAVRVMLTMRASVGGRRRQVMYEHLKLGTSVRFYIQYLVSLFLSIEYFVH